MNGESENKKIGLLLTSPSWGGLEMNVLKLANLLYTKRYDLSFFLIKNSRIAKELSQTSIKTYYIQPHHKYFDVFGAFKFSDLLKKLSIRNLLTFDNRDLDFVFYVKVFFRYRINVIYQQHMQIGVPKKDMLHTLRYSAINYWLTPLELLKKEIERQTRFNLSKVKVVPLGTDIQKFISNKYTKFEARERLGIHSTSFIIGIIGRIDPKKGQLFLIKAIHNLRKSFPQLELLIVGEPTHQDIMCEIYLKEINAYISQHNIAESIYLRDFTKDVSLFYNAIDLFVLASENETYGMVTIESLLSGVPVVATNSAGTPELLNYGEFGHLYSPFNMNEFCAAVSDVMDNFDRTVLMAKKGKLEAIKRYSQDLECASLQELIV